MTAASVRARLSTAHSTRAFEFNQRINQPWGCDLAAPGARKIAELTIDRRAIEFERADYRLSETKPFSWRRNLPPLVAKKTLFNYVATYNDFERGFAEFLDGAIARPHPRRARAGFLRMWRAMSVATCTALWLEFDTAKNSEAMGAPGLLYMRKGSRPPG
jgi:hypothetical protein